MEIKIDPNGLWYHGSPLVFQELLPGSTVTQWQALAEAFSHKPTALGYEDDGSITHNGVETGYLYVIDEPVQVGVDLLPHPRTTMDKNAEFLTQRPLRVRMIASGIAPGLPAPVMQPAAPPFIPQPGGFIPRPLPPPVPPNLFPRQKAFTWMDVFTVLGFVASLVGYFFISIVLLPLGLVFSLLGFRGDKTRGLAVAGIVISAIGLLIRLMILLNDSGLLPDWITSGIW